LYCKKNEVGPFGPTSLFYPIGGTKMKIGKFDLNMDDEMSNFEQYYDVNIRVIEIDHWDNYIPAECTFFCAKRKVMYGLEGFLADKVDNDDHNCHDYEGSYLYLVSSQNGDLLYISFHEDEVTVGGSVKGSLCIKDL